MQVSRLSVTRLLAELYDKVHEATASEKKQLKEEIKSKRDEIKEGYLNTASTQGSQGTLWKTSAAASLAVTIGSVFVPNETVKRIAQSLPDIGSQVSRGFDNNLSGRATKEQGFAQIGQKELEEFHSRLQEAGNNLHTAQQLLESTQRDEKQAIQG